MTIRILQQWNGYSPDQIVSNLSGTEETRLIGLGFATADLDGANDGVLVDAKLTTTPSGGVAIQTPSGFAPFFGTPAESFGFSQFNTAAQNATALASAMASGGLVSVVTPGSYLSNLVTGPAATAVTLYLGPGVEVELGAGANSPFFVNPAYTTYMLGGGTTVTVTSSGSVATVAWPAHGKAVGDFIWLLNADQPEYNGVWPVDTVADSGHLTFKFNADSAVTPATGTIKAGLADHGIVITGEGTINGNSANQSFAGDGPGKNLINLMNVAHCEFSLKHVKNQSRYGVFIANSLDSGGHDVDFQSTALGQDGFHVSGPQRGQCVIEGITGQCGDDLISLMTGDINTWGVPSGDTQNIIVRDVNCKGGTTTIVKIDGAPITGTVHNNIQLEGVHGKAPSQGGIMAMVYAPGSLQTYTVKRLKMTDLDFKPYSGAPMFSANNGITIDHATVDGVQIDYTGLANAAVFRNFGSTVNSLNVSDVKAKGMANGGAAIVDMDTTATYGIVSMTNVESVSDTNGYLMRADGALTNLRMTNVHKSGGGALLAISATCTSTPTVELSDARQGAAASGCLFNGSAVLLSRNFKSVSGAAMVTVAAGKTLTWDGDAYNSNNPANPHLSNSGTANVSGASIRVDVMTIARRDGAIVYNTNAAAGTLGVAGLVVCQGTASGSWHLMSDPTKTY